MPQASLDALTSAEMAQKSTLVGRHQHGKAVAAAPAIPAAPVGPALPGEA